MNGPRINNDDRGLTINKTLAWSILAFLVAQGGGAIWTVSEMSSRIGAVERMTTEDRAAIARNAAAIVAVQRTEARTDQRLQGIEAGLSRIEASVADLVRYLREQQR
jgi:hypothetical protein